MHTGQSIVVLGFYLGNRSVRKDGDLPGAHWCGVRGQRGRGRQEEEVGAGSHSHSSRRNSKTYLERRAHAHVERFNISTVTRQDASRSELQRTRKSPGESKCLKRLSPETGKRGDSRDKVGAVHTLLENVSSLEGY